VSTARNVLLAMTRSPEHRVELPTRLMPAAIDRNAFASLPKRRRLPADLDNPTRAISFAHAIRDVAGERGF